MMCVNLLKPRNTLNTKHVYVGKGRYAAVSVDWIDRIKTDRWCLLKNGYAARNVHPRGSAETYMHRLIAGAGPGDVVDHADMNRLNNQSDNLRLCNNSHNKQNQPKHVDNQSGYKGVSWHKPNGAYRSRITINGVTVFLGYFSDPHEGARAYDRAARMYHDPRFARPNFPDET